MTSLSLVLVPAPTPASHLHDPPLVSHPPTPLEDRFPVGPAHLVRNREGTRVKVSALVTNRSGNDHSTPVRCYLGDEALITWNPLTDAGETAHVHASHRLEPGARADDLDVHCEPWRQLWFPKGLPRHFFSLGGGGIFYDYPRSGTRADFKIRMTNVDDSPRVPFCAWWVPRGRVWLVVPRESQTRVQPGERIWVRGTFYLRPHADFELLDDVEEVCR